MPVLRGVVLLHFQFFMKKNRHFCLLKYFMTIKKIIKKVPWFMTAYFINDLLINTTP